MYFRRQCELNLFWERMESYAGLDLGQQSVTLITMNRHALARASHGHGHGLLGWLENARPGFAQGLIGERDAQRDTRDCPTSFPKLRKTPKIHNPCSSWETKANSTFPSPNSSQQQAPPLSPILCLPSAAKITSTFVFAGLLVFSHCFCIAGCEFRTGLLASPS